MSTPVEQGIEVPKITLEDGIPQRAVLREPLRVEQLADVPVPETGGATGEWVAHPMFSGAARRDSPPAQGGKKILGRAEAWQLGRPCDHAAPVPAVLHRVRGGASDSVLRQSGGFSCFTETGLTVPTVQKTGFHGAVLGRLSTCTLV